MTAAVQVPRAAVPARRPSYWGRYRRALWLLTTRDLKVRYTTSRLSYLWSILDPLLMALVFYAVFTFIYPRGDATQDPFIVFLLTALLPWTWFNGNLSDATRAFRQESKLIRSVKIPRSLWILRQICSKGIEFAISLPILVFFAIVNTIAPTPMALVYLPLAIGLQILCTLGINFIVAPLCVFYRDLERVVKLTLRVLFWIAPVLHSLPLTDPLQRFLYGLDPLVGFLTLYRACFFPEVLDWTWVLESAIVSLLLFAVGSVVFRRSMPRVLKEL